MRKIYCLFAAVLCMLCGTAQKKPVTRKSKTEEQPIICLVEQESRFPGGTAAWMKYIEQKNRFDSIYQLLTEDITSWTVTVQFVITREGAVEVTGIKGDSALHPLFKTEIIRLFQQSPKWEAAEQNGRKIKSFRSQKIGFEIPADEKEEPVKKTAPVPGTPVPQKILPGGSNGS